MPHADCVSVRFWTLHYVFCFCPLVLSEEAITMRSLYGTLTVCLAASLALSACGSDSSSVVPDRNAAEAPATTPKETMDEFEKQMQELESTVNEIKSKDASDYGLPSSRGGEVINASVGEPIEVCTGQGDCSLTLTVNSIEKMDQCLDSTGNPTPAQQNENNNLYRISVDFDLADNGDPAEQDMFASFTTLAVWQEPEADGTTVPLHKSLCSPATDNQSWNGDIIAGEKVTKDVVLEVPPSVQTAQLSWFSSPNKWNFALN